MRKNKCDICGKESNKTKICPECGSEVCPKHWDIECCCCDECVNEVIHNELLNDLEEW